MKVEVKWIDPRLKEKCPAYATQGSAGLDLLASLREAKKVEPNETTLVPTGLAIYIQDPTYAGLIFPRSGLGHKHGIVLGNLVGLIDADYQGEIMVSIWNRSDTAYVTEPLEKIAQLVIMPVIQMKMQIVNEFSNQTIRMNDGFGSTGKHQ